MSLEIRSTPSASHIDITLCGLWQQQAMVRAIESIRELATRHSATRILVDARQVQGYRSELDKFLIGQRLAQVLPPPFEMAVIERPGEVNKFSENTAVNRGARILITDSEAEAKAWLKLDGTDRASA